MTWSGGAPAPTYQAIMMASPTSGDLPMRFLISVLSSMRMPRCFSFHRGACEVCSHDGVGASATPDSLPYKIAALDCNIARINIEYDVMNQPECGSLPDTTRKSRNKSEARMRDAAS
jgi:hypothetical protein